MAKLFKTISLEERWKGSIHDIQPKRTIQDIEQPTPDLKQTLPTPVKEIENLKLLIPNKKNTGLLVPTFDAKQLSDYVLPFVNTKFRSSINLENRLKQTNLGTTNHLPQFFLSDIFTDYISIVPFTVFNHTSDISIVLPTSTANNALNQGIYNINGVSLSNVNISIPSYDNLLLQGTYFINGTYFSYTNTVLNSFNAIAYQGTTFINGNYMSLINVQNSVAPGTLTTIPNINPATPSNNQTISLLQGMIANTNGDLVSPIEPVISLLLPILIPTNIIITETLDELPILIPANIVITNITSTPLQGGLDPILINFEPNRSSPTLEVLRYAADRALAFFLPRVKHGSSDLSPTETKPGYFQNAGILYTEYNFEDAVKARDIMIKGTDSDEAKYFQGQFNWSDKPNILYIKTGNDSSYSYVLGESATIQDEFDLNIDTVLKSKKSELTGAGGQITKDTKEIPINGEASQKLANQSDETPIGGSLSSYSTLTYDQIKSRSFQTGEREDFRKTLTFPVKGGNGKKVVLRDQPIAERVEHISIDNDKDFITLKIGGETFRAFLTSFNDNVTVNWQDLKYVGRQDTLKTFVGSTRGASIAFKIAAFKEEDMKENYRKLDSLIRNTAVGTAPAGEFETPFVKAPVTYVTVGNWFVKTPCIVNSIKYDIQIAEYSWDIDRQVPHIIDVSLDFTLLGDIDGKPLNATSNKYIEHEFSKP